MAGSTFQPPINLDPHQDPTQQTAFINQNFQSLASSLNPFIVSDGTNNRIILGKQTDGTYGMKVSQTGVDVGTATNSQLIFNSNQDIFKIVSSGAVTTVVASVAAGGTNTTTIAHNLGIVPAFMCYVTLPNNFPSNILQSAVVAMPTAAFIHDSAGNGVVLFWVGARADSTNLYLEVSNVTTGSMTGPFTFTFKYYILQETAT